MNRWVAGFALLVTTGAGCAHRAGMATARRVVTEPPPAPAPECVHTLKSTDPAGVQVVATCQSRDPRHTVALLADAADEKATAAAIAFGATKRIVFSGSRPQVAQETQMEEGPQVCTTKSNATQRFFAALANSNNNASTNCTSNAYGPTVNTNCAHKPASAPILLRPDETTCSPGRMIEVTRTTVSVVGWFLNDADLTALDLTKFTANDRLINLVPPVSAPPATPR